MTPPHPDSERFRIGSRGGGWRAALRDIFFGMFYYGLHKDLTHTAIKQRDVVHVLLLGEFLGLPLVGSYYTLRILPYLLEDMPGISRRVLRDWDVMELLHEGASVH